MQTDGVVADLSICGRRVVEGPAFSPLAGWRKTALPWVPGRFYFQTGGLDA